MLRTTGPLTAQLQNGVSATMAVDGSRNVTVTVTLTNTTAANAAANFVFGTGVGWTPGTGSSPECSLSNIAANCTLTLAPQERRRITIRYTVPCGGNPVEIGILQGGADFVIRQTFVPSGCLAGIDACENGTDDDGDGRIDYPADIGCTAASDNDETNDSCLTGLVRDASNQWQNQARPYDVDNDGDIDDTDVSVLAAFIASRGGVFTLPTATSTQPPPYGDVNDDSLIDNFDVAAITNYRAQCGSGGSSSSQASSLAYQTALTCSAPIQTNRADNFNSYQASNANAALSNNPNWTAYPTSGSMRIERRYPSSPACEGSLYTWKNPLSGGSLSSYLVFFPSYTNTTQGDIVRTTYPCTNNSQTPPAGGWAEIRFVKAGTTQLEAVDGATLRVTLLEPFGSGVASDVTLTTYDKNDVAIESQSGRAGTFSFTRGIVARVALTGTSLSRFGLDEVRYTALACPECSDGTDNDVDGFIDFPTDAGCTSTSDNSEVNAASSAPAGTAACYQNLASPGTAYDLATADFNNDGYADFVAPRANGNDVYTYISSGPGTYTTGSVSLGTPTGYYVVAGNFDSDDNPDFVVSGAQGTTYSLRIYKGNGNGTFSPNGSVSNIRPMSRMSVADFNGDGIDDIVVGGNTLQLLVGSAGGGFASPVTLPSTGYAGNNFYLTGDFNGDGTPDIASMATSNGQTGIRVLRNNGSATFSAVFSPRTPQSVNPYIIGMSAGDLNGDGATDLFLAQNASNGEIFLSTKGTGGWNTGGTMTFGSVVASSASIATVIVDADNDGRQDIVALGSGNGMPGGIAVFRGTGNGTVLPSPSAIPFGKGSSNVVAGDFNNDGKTDLATVHGWNGFNVPPVSNNYPGGVSLLLPPSSASTLLQCAAPATSSAASVASAASSTSAAGGGAWGYGKIKAVRTGTFPWPVYGTANRNGTYAAFSICYDKTDYPFTDFTAFLVDLYIGDKAAGGTLLERGVRITTMNNSGLDQVRTFEQLCWGYNVPGREGDYYDFYAELSTGAASTLTATTTSKQVHAYMAATYPTNPASLYSLRSPEPGLSLGYATYTPNTQNVTECNDQFDNDSDGQVDTGTAVAFTLPQTYSITRLEPVKTYPRVAVMQGQQIVRGFTITGDAGCATGIRVGFDGGSEPLTPTAPTNAPTLRIEQATPLGATYNCTVSNVQIAYARDTDCTGALDTSERPTSSSAASSAAPPSSASSTPATVGSYSPYSCTVGKTALHVETADLNKDGTADFVASMGGEGSLLVYLSNQQGGYTVSYLPITTPNPSGYWNIQHTLRDFTKDGNPDLVLMTVVPAGRDPIGAIVLKGKGNGTFDPPVEQPSGNVSVRSPFFVADADGDGSLDLLFFGDDGYTEADYVDDHFHVMRGDGTGAFSAPQEKFAIGYKNLTESGDFNGDGVTDAAYATYLPDANNKGIRVLLNSGGTFTPVDTPFDVPSGPYANSMHAADFNGDGADDLFVADNGTYGRIYLNDGDGSFTMKQRLDNAGGATTAVHDFNGDGRLDVIVAGGLLLAPGDVRVFLGRATIGTEVVNPVPQTIAYTKAFSVVLLGDFDGDGETDFAFGHGLQNSGTQPFPPVDANHPAGVSFLFSDGAPAACIVPASSSSVRSSSAAASSQGPECNDGIDNDGDGGIDALVTSTSVATHTFPSPWGTEGQPLTGVRAFLNSLPIPSVVERQLRYLGNESDAVNADDATATEICKRAGFTKMVSYTTSGYSSPGDSDLAYWNGSVFTFKNAQTGGNSFIASLVCSNPAACGDGLDNDGDGAVDTADSGCASATDENERLHDPHCTSLTDTLEAGSQCADSLDNDADGATDYPADFSCSAALDDDETMPKAECQDGIDNDADGQIDLNDAGCRSAQDNSEVIDCQDGKDNDGDGVWDMADPGCDSPLDENEADEQCSEPTVLLYNLQPIPFPDSGNPATLTELRDAGYNVTYHTRLSLGRLTENFLRQFSTVWLMDGCGNELDVLRVDEVSALEAFFKTSKGNLVLSAGDVDKHGIPNGAECVARVNQVASHLGFAFTTATAAPQKNCQAVTGTTPLLNGVAEMQRGGGFALAPVQGGLWNNAPASPVITFADGAVVAAHTPANASHGAALLLPSFAPLKASCNGGQAYRNLFGVLDDARLGCPCSQAALRNESGLLAWVRRLLGSLLPSRFLAQTAPTAPSSCQRTQCNDGIDNDGDDKVDLSDLGCLTPDDDTEQDDITPIGGGICVIVAAGSKNVTPSTMIADCPAGFVPTGGGWRGYGVTDTSNDRSHPVNGGWECERNEGEDARCLAVCCNGLVVETTTVVATGKLSDHLIPECPAGYTMTGGGFTDDRPGTDEERLGPEEETGWHCFDDGSSVDSSTCVAICAREKITQAPLNCVTESVTAPHTPPARPRCTDGRVVTGGGFIDNSTGNDDQDNNGPLVGGWYCSEDYGDSPPADGQCFARCCDLPEPAPATVVATVTGPATTQAGATVTYTISMRNVSTVPAIDAFLRNHLNLPGALVKNLPAGCTDHGWLSTGGFIVECYHDTLAPDAVVSYQLSYVVPQNAPCTILDTVGADAANAFPSPIDSATTTAPCGSSSSRSSSTPPPSSSSVGACSYNGCLQGGADYCQGIGATCQSNPQSPCFSCFGGSQSSAGVACAFDGCAQGGDAYCTQRQQYCLGTGTTPCFICTSLPPSSSSRSSRASSASSASSAVTFLPSSSAASVCSFNGCLQGGDAYCGLQGAECIASPGSPCFACANQSSSVTGNACDQSGCLRGGIAYCSAQGLGCQPSDASPCFACEGDVLATETSSLQENTGFCVAGSDCTSGYCDGYVCAACREANDCGGLLVCIDGTCVDPSLLAFSAPERAAVCGDGLREQQEECDDGNGTDGDGCTWECLLENGACGDGVMQRALGEQCDVGVLLPPGAVCTPRCTLVLRDCGNGMPDEGEECDDGPANSDGAGAHCRRNCTVGRCGDRIVDAPAETCDDGNRLSGDGCDSRCVREGTPAQDTTPLMAPAAPSVLPAWAAVPAITESGTLGQTGPAAVAAMAAGAAGGLAWVRRKKRKKTAS